MYICMHVRMHVCICACMYEYMYVCIHGCWYVRTYVCMYVCMYARIHNLYTSKIVPIPERPREQISVRFLCFSHMISL